jgi:hypothetical protein
MLLLLLLMLQQLDPDVAAVPSGAAPDLLQIKYANQPIWTLRKLMLWSSPP